LPPRAIKECEQPRRDTLNNPKLIEDDKLLAFDVVIANPPFSLDKWGAENAANDKYKRFHRGVTPINFGSSYSQDGSSRTHHASHGPEREPFEVPFDANGASSARGMAECCTEEE
jgi:hypothetical protein